MTRSELVARMAHRFPHLVQQDARMATDLILDAIAESLTRGGRVEIRNFGRFSIHARREKLGRNPRTGEPVFVPEKRVPYFKPGTGLLKSLHHQDT